METDPTPNQSPAPDSPAVADCPAPYCCGFRPGDVGYVSSWNYARRLILSIEGEFAECLDENGNECRQNVHYLETLDQWTAAARRCGEDSDLKMSEVRAYIDAMTGAFDPPAKWTAALKDIHNA